MTTFDSLKWDGKKSGKISLDLKVAKESSAGDLLHRAVLRQLANKRQGTASTLTRSEVRGGGRKPYKQKGTGRARQGSIRTPLRPGGGILFGPKPRSYNLDMNRKERRLALRTALMSRTSDLVRVEAVPCLLFANCLNTALWSKSPAEDSLATFKSKEILPLFLPSHFRDSKVVMIYYLLCFRPCYLVLYLRETQVYLVQIL